MKMVSIADVRTILNNISEIWIIVDIRGMVLIVNDHIEKLGHFIQPPISEGSSIFESLHGSWKDLARGILTRLTETGESTSVEANFKDERGQQIYFEIKCHAIGIKDEPISQILIQALDVTPQKIYENKITIVAREYQNLIENANAVIIGIDTRGYITEWNETASKVTRYSKHESLAQKISDLLIRHEEQEKFSHAMNEVLHGKVITNYELTIRAKEQDKVTLLINATPRKSVGEEVIGILLIGQDITELSTYRESLERKVHERTEALKMALQNEKELVEVKDRFVSMASHEFRSPISYIHRNIQVIKGHITKLRPEEIKEKLEKIQSQAEHLSSLLEDVLTIGKSGVVKITPNVKAVALKEFLLRIIDEVQSNTNNTHRIVLNFSASLLPIASDENLLRNIFVNLLTNAIKFSPGQTEVFFSVRAQDHKLIFSVKDNGLGIEEKDLHKIFEPFHRGENVQKIKGTGLGLPIVKKAVETLGGELGVESKIGQGTLFTIQLNINTIS